jgi:hypothetical protein
MGEAWTVYYSEQGFVAPLESRLLEIQGKLAAAPSGKQLEKLFVQWDELKHFNAARRLIRSGMTDLPVLLRPACEWTGDIIPDYYVLTTANISGYYRVDHSQRICLGLLVRCDSGEAIADLAGALIEAHGRFSDER